MFRNFIYTILVLYVGSTVLNAQNEDFDLLSLLDDDEETTEYTYASFKTNRVINLHSLENTAAGVFDFKISHRFNAVNGGLYDLFGLDGATIRIAGDIGVTDRLAVGFGRSTIEKAYDGYIKYKFLRQSTGKKNMPITAAFLATTAVNTLRWQDPERDNKFSSRLFYTFQAIIGRKFNENFTLQLSPTLVHRNLIPSRDVVHDVLALGAGTRIKLTKRTSINLEYIYVFPDQIAPEFNNSLSVGFDIETGGHVFQLHFTNSRAMIDKAFITETSGSWLDGDIHFGFNISRVFNINSNR
jgi:hypothetical protein